MQRKARRPAGARARKKKPPEMIRRWCYFSFFGIPGPSAYFLTASIANLTLPMAHGPPTQPPSHAMTSKKLPGIFPVAYICSILTAFLSIPLHGGTDAARSGVTAAGTFDGTGHFMRLNGFKLQIEGNKHRRQFFKSQNKIGVDVD